MVFRKPAEGRQGLLATLYTGTFAVKDFLDPIGEFLGPIDIILLRILIIQ